MKQGAVTHGAESDRNLIVDGSVLDFGEIWSEHDCGIHPVESGIRNTFVAVLEGFTSASVWTLAPKAIFNVSAISTSVSVIALARVVVPKIQT